LSSRAEQRRNAIAPFRVERPAFEFLKSIQKEKASTVPRPKALREFEMLLRFERLDHYVLAHLSAIHEFNAARDLGEERVVFAFADIESGLYARAALPDDDRSARDKLSAECLKAKALRVRVASVS
jgi:hypothetical protein